MRAAVIPLTFEEYVVYEQQQDIRHEFVYGNLIPMPGESKIANTIALNGAFALREGTHAKGYVVYSHEVRLEVVPGKLYRYPDVMLAAADDVSDTHAVTTPVLIIEVTSENSLARDHGEKLREYSNLHTLQYYLIVSQEEQLVELYSRSPQGWQYSYFTLNQTIALPFIDMELPLARLYAFTNL